MGKMKLYRCTAEHCRTLTANGGGLCDKHLAPEAKVRAEGWPTDAQWAVILAEADRHAKAQAAVRAHRGALREDLDDRRLAFERQERSAEQPVFD
jgi:hypothetical protein